MMQNPQLSFGMDTPPGFGCGRPMSVSEYARRRGVSHFAVQRAIKDGRLTQESVITDHRGHPKIVDPVKADEEWDQNTQVKASDRPQNGDGQSSLALVTIRERNWKAKLAELEYRTRARELSPVKDMHQEYSAFVVEIRNLILGLPTRFKQRVPHLSHDDLLPLDELVREILEKII